MKALLTLDLGEKGKDYIKILDKPVEYKRSKINIKEEGGKINIEVEAKDPIALIASINSVLKQLRIVSNVEEIFE